MAKLGCIETGTLVSAALGVPTILLTFYIDSHTTAEKVWFGFHAVNGRVHMTEELFFSFVAVLGMYCGTAFALNWLWGKAHGW